MGLKCIRFKKGDSIPKLAERYGVTVEQLLRDNGMATSAVRLNAGDRILVPTTKD